MNLASTSNQDENKRIPNALPSGLGFLDSTKSTLDVEIVLTPDIPPLEHMESVGDDLGKSTLISVPARRRRKVYKRTKEVEVQEVKVSVKVQQDLNALKGRKGDTGGSSPYSVIDIDEVLGSVLWRSRFVYPPPPVLSQSGVDDDSLHLARHVLSQHLYSSTKSLLDYPTLASSHILELGAGTGVLAALLNPLCGSYTASDRLENLRLVERNLLLNGIKLDDQKHGVMYKGVRMTKKKSKTGGEESKQVLIEEIDWVEVSKDRQRSEARSPKSSKSPLSPLPPRSTRSELFVGSPSSFESSWASPSSPSVNLRSLNLDTSVRTPYDLILAVDCIFNENLVQPLVDTLTRYCPVGGDTVLWVVVELRSIDVVSNSGSGSDGTASFSSSHLKSESMDQ